MAAKRVSTADEHLERISAKTSLGRLVTAERDRGFRAFLASPRSVALTGEALALTCGLGTSVYF
jgi:enoyl-[acyl-carrier-protein] reductase (NADH)